MVGVAVKVTEDPAHDGFDPDVIAMETEGVATALMVIVMLLLLAVVGLAQLAFEVMSQVTTWPFVRPVVV